MKKLVLIAFSLYYIILMLTATPIINGEGIDNSSNQEQHFVDNTAHNFGNKSMSLFFEEEEDKNFDLTLSLASFPVFQKLIFLFKSENPKHTCFAYYLDLVIKPYHQDIYILDEVYRI